MTGRTHDLAAFTTLGVIALSSPLHTISLGTLLISIAANLIGGIAPDIDQPTADLWRKLPGGGVIGRIVSPLLGGHRFISHSFFGLFIFGFVSRWLLTLASHTILVNMTLVWDSFMIGFISHLVMDTITKEGVPWLFPIPIKFAFPPIRALRVKTGGLVETAIIFPGLLLINGYLYYSHYHEILSFLHSYIH